MVLDKLFSARKVRHPSDAKIYACITHLDFYPVRMHACACLYLEKSNPPFQPENVCFLNVDFSPFYCYTTSVFSAFSPLFVLRVVWGR